MSAIQQTFKARIPLIKFRKGGLIHNIIRKEKSPKITATDYIPSRFNRKPLTLLEMETIERGGSDL